nr:hypothetical protein [Ramlibacter tataouinensis]
MDFFDNRVTRSTGTISLRAVVRNSERRLTPGLFARVQLPVDEPSDALLIDENAVLTDQDRKYVYVVDADGNAQRREVQLGGTSERLRVVRSGVAAGDRLVVEGMRRILRSGMPVTAQAAGLTSPTAAATNPDVSPQAR